MTDVFFSREQVDDGSYGWAHHEVDARIHRVHRALEARWKEDLVVVESVVHHVQSLPLEMFAVCLDKLQHRFTSHWRLIPHGDWDLQLVGQHADFEHTCACFKAPCQP
jgi:hypothetical protein